jgi:cytochrome c biogenesis protein CcmG/thiol:disulfide interchange protein DsbE
MTVLGAASRYQIEVLREKMRIRGWCAAELLLLLPVLWGQSNAVNGPAQAKATAGAGELELAPDFVLQDGGGKEVRLSDYRGKVVALNFWATWCGPCKVEVPWLNQLEMEHAKQRFAVIGISFDEQGWRAVKPFLAKLNVQYRVLLGDLRTRNLYGGVDVLPTTLLIDRDRRIAAVYSGVVNRKKFETTLAELLRRKAAKMAGSKDSKNQERRNGYFVSR